MGCEREWVNGIVVVEWKPCFFFSIFFSFRQVYLPKRSCSLLTEVHEVYPISLEEKSMVGAQWHRPPYLGTYGLRRQR